MKLTDSKKVLEKSDDSDEEENIQDLDIEQLFEIRPESENGSSVTLCTVDAKKFFDRDTGIVMWPFNRNIDEPHVTEIYEHFLSTCSKRVPPNLRTLCIGYYTEENRYYLLDGQHRTEAGKLYLKKYPSRNFRIVVEIHRLSNEEEVIDLFNQVNSNKVLEAEETPHRGAIRIISRIKREFSKDVFSEKGRVYYPKMDYVKVHSKFKQLLQDGVMTEDEIFDRVVLLDNRYRKLHKKGEISSITSRPNIGPSIEKAKRYGMFLGLDEHHHWLQKIK